MCDGFNVQVVYTDLPNDKFQLVMMLSKAGRRRRFAAAPSRFGGLLAGVFSASFTALGSPADVPALKFACMFGRHSSLGHFRRSEPPAQRICAARCSRLCVGAHPKRAHAPSPSRFQFLSPCGQFSNVSTIPSNLFCAGHGKERGLKGASQVCVTRTARA